MVAQCSARSCCDRKSLIYSTVRSTYVHICELRPEMTYLALRLFRLFIIFLIVRAVTCYMAHWTSPRLDSPLHIKPCNVHSTWISRAHIFKLILITQIPVYKLSKSAFHDFFSIHVCHQLSSCVPAGQRPMMDVFMLVWYTVVSYTAWCRLGAALYSTRKLAVFLRVSNTEIKNTWSYAPIPPLTFKCTSLHPSCISSATWIQSIFSHPASWNP